MNDISKEENFKRDLEELVRGFGEESQEGVKEALRKCQDDFGLVSKSHVTQIADAFNLDEKIVKTIIKFMPTVKESNVEYEIICCTGPRCAKNGSREVIKTIKNTLGIDFNETTSDGKISLRGQNCFKKCKLGPNIMINKKFYHHMNKEKAEEILSEIVSK